MDRVTASRNETIIAGVAASLSIEDRTPVRSVSLPRMQQELLARGAVLIYYRDAGPAHPNYQAVQYVGIRGFVPDWNANLDAPVSREEAERWIERADLPAPVAYTPDVTRRGALLQAMYERLADPRGAGDDGRPIPR